MPHPDPLTPDEARPRGKLPLGFDSFTVAPDRLKREFTGRRSRPVVLSGKRTTILQVANGIPVGTVTVTTSVILRLVRST